MTTRTLLPWLGFLAVSLGVAAQPAHVAGLARQSNAPPRFAGTVLLTELGCTACHATPRPSLAPKLGPDLSAAGSRLAARHLARWIEAPLPTKPGTTMPDVLGHLPAGTRTTDAQALTHFLASLGGPPPPAGRPEPGSVERGRALYHSVGCVACHAPEAGLPDSVPLGPLHEKYTLAGLTRFLEDPLALRPSGRMPDLRLNHFEAAEIASFLLRDHPVSQDNFQPDATLVARGRSLFTEHRCSACHPGVTGDRTPAPPALDQLRPGKGCLSKQPGPWPRYDLTDAQREALQAALAGPAQPPQPAEEVELTLARLNCRACHERNGSGGPAPDRDTYFTSRDPNLGEQGRLPPSLTGVGAKLKARWLREVVVNGAEARPYLVTRMPRFGAPASESLAGWLKQVDPALPALEVRIPEADKPRQAGRELAGSKGFNCVACHVFRGRSAAPIRALDLTTMTDRLEAGWFHRYLESPRRFSPLTIMPDFWPGGQSPLTEVLGGDPTRQREALWQYLAEGPEAGEPQGLVLEPLVITVGEEAVMLRRAYPGIGKRGIGVGYPAGIHLAFDAGQLRLGSIWSGGFIDASPLWRGQGAGQARILGRDRVDFPAGPAFAILGSDTAPWPAGAEDFGSETRFLGYRVDTRRRPTFRYHIGSLQVEDRFVDLVDPKGRPYFERHLEFPGSSLPANLFFRVAENAEIQAGEGRDYRIGRGLLVRPPAGALVREVGERRQLLVPVRGSLVLEYHLTAQP